MLLPEMVRKPKFLAFAAALLTPMVALYGRFLAFADDAVYRVSHNGSIVSLQDMLNDKFDPEDRGIFIKNIQQQDAVRFYSLAAEKQVGFYSAPNQKTGFRYSLEYNPEAADFTVHVPVGLQPGSPELLESYLIKMRGQVDYYKLYAKKYRIEWY